MNSDLIKSLQAIEDYLRMDDTQIQLSPDHSFLDDLLNLSADDSFLDYVQNLSLDDIFLDDIQKFFDESTDYAVESETNPPQDSTQDHPALPEEPVEDSIPMDGGVPPLPSTGRDELTTNPQTDSAQRHHIILDPIFETFFKRHDESPRSPTSEDNLRDTVEPSKPTSQSLDGGVPPLPSIGRDELTTNPQTDSAQRHHIILDPIFETFFKTHDESPQSPTCDVLPLQDNLSDSVESSKPTPHSTQQHPPPTSQSLEVPVSTFQPLQNISNQQHVHAQLHQPNPTPLQSPTPPNKRQKISSKRCGCKVNKCQKRHCGCYAAGELCGENCSCQGCFNKSEYEATKKRNNNMGHNPQAMYGAPTLNPFAPSSAVNIASLACRQANSFTTSSNISPPQAVQMAMMAQQQANSCTTSSNICPPQAVQTAMMAQQQPNSFVPSSNISPPQAVQMAFMAQPQANPFASSSNVSPPVLLADMARSRANPGTTYQPQQQHMLMNPTNPQQMAFMAQPQANPFASSSNISPPVLLADMARSRANPSTTYQPQQQHMLMNPTNPQQMAFMAQPRVNPFASSSNISPPVLLADMARSRANLGTTYQPQQQHMLMNPTNPQQMGHRASSVNSGSRSSMQIPPRLRSEADKIDMYWE